MSRWLAELWDWVAGVVERINDVSVYWLLFALALKTAESALIGVTATLPPPQSSSVSRFTAVPLGS